MNLLDGTKQIITKDITFVPQSRNPPSSGYDLLEEPQDDRQFVVTEKIVSMFGATLGTAEVVSVIPERYHIEEDRKTLNIDIEVEFLWHGERKTLPDWRQVAPVLHLYQRAEQTHWHEGDHRPPPLLLKAHKLEKITIKPNNNAPYPYYWCDNTPNVFRMHSKIYISYVAEEPICPSFITCLVSRSYKLQLTFGLFCPYLTVGKERQLVIDVPISIKSSVKNGPDPDPVFLAKWNKRLLGPTLSPDDLLEFWKSDSRKPEYGEALDTITHTAPTHSPPQYFPEENDINEANRPPAWQRKATDGRNSSSSSDE